MTEIERIKTIWKRSTVEIITFTEGTLADIIQLARKDINSLITTIESQQNMNCAECSNKDEELEKWKNEGLRLMAVNQHLEIDFQSQKEEIDNFKSDIERIHERVLEAIADQPDDYASYFAVLDIQAIIDHRKEISK